ncbi:unnamed protein product [Adineta steineri]|uniref:ABC transporter domain-containing protein n=1 Tax=Adineta steineri TaxID=433720 RepID=A0A813RPT5_9BILA|nr:unnamed protein product [Adineta steineri]CAF3544016.1 unnamed protein product [Adineta steineri]
MPNRNADERRPFVADDEIAVTYDSTKVDIATIADDHLAVDHPLTMSWQQLNVTIDIIPRNNKWFKQSKNVLFTKQLLANLNGHAVPGKIVAIMGSSGAGKTTLLGILSGRFNKHLKISGTISLNGLRVDGSTLLNRCGYIEQNELFIGSMTVREHLTFQAMLRMKTNTDEYRHERIEDVLQVLDLISCQNTIIGIPGKLKGLSGGELRRLTFASVILTNPALLLIDEPTSGLDSNLAISVMNTMKRLADQGKTIISVLHQPSSQIFHMVDTLCLLSHGHLVYFGSRLDAPDFFQSMDRQCPPNCNPSEFYIEQLSSRSDDTKDEDESTQLPLEWKHAVETFQQSQYNQKLQKSIEDEIILSKMRSDKFETDICYQSNFFRQLKWLLWRSFRASSRNPVHSTSLLIKSVLPALILGVLYFQLKQTPEIVQNLNAISFVILTSVCYTNAFVILATFPGEFQVFKREHRRRLYGTSAYYIARFFTELPFFIIMPWIFTTIVYVCVGISKSFLTYILYCLFAILATNASVAFSGIVAALANSVDSAVSIALPLLEIFMLFGGFFLNNASVPVYFTWLQYSTWYYYAYSLILIFLWRDIKHIPCDTQGFCLSNGNKVLEFYQIDKHLIAFYLGMLLLLIIVYHSITFIIIWIRAKRA